MCVSCIAYINNLPYHILLGQGAVTRSGEPLIYIAV